MKNIREKIASLYSNALVRAKQSKTYSEDENLPKRYRDAACAEVQKYSSYAHAYSNVLAILAKEEVSDVEPKFKIGDKIVGDDGHEVTITAINSNAYAIDYRQACIFFRDQDKYKLAEASNKFKVGDVIEPVDEVLGEPRTITAVHECFYETDKGTLDIEFEDNWNVQKPKCVYGHSEEMKKRFCKYCSVACPARIYSGEPLIIPAKIGWAEGMFLDYNEEELHKLINKSDFELGDDVQLIITKKRK